MDYVSPTTLLLARSGKQYRARTMPWFSYFLCLASTHYTVLYDISKGVKGGVISYSRRDKKKKTKIPGPQDYCVRVSFFKIPFSPFLFFFLFFFISSFLPSLTEDNAGRASHRERCNTLLFYFYFCFCIFNHVAFTVKSLHRVVRIEEIFQRYLGQRKIRRGQEKREKSIAPWLLEESSQMVRCTHQGL